MNINILELFLIVVSCYSLEVCCYYSSEYTYNFYDVVPHYGPASGGTNVTVRGDFLSIHVSKAYLAEPIPRSPLFLECEILDENKTNWRRKYIVTPALTLYENTTLLGVELLLLFEVQEIDSSGIFGESKTWNTGFTFQYREDPVITYLKPNHVYLSGGKELTVKGRNFNSVYAPQMQIYMENRIVEIVNETLKNITVVNLKIFKSPVTYVLDSTTIISISPKIDFHYNETVVSQDGFANFFDTPELKFHIGFILDGVKKYKNLTENDDVISSFWVTADPKLYPFEHMKLFNPHKDHYIVIYGKSLRLGGGDNHYRIQIGLDECYITQVTNYEIICIPPMQPTEFMNDMTILNVNVFVGFINVHIGYVKYPDFMLKKTFSTEEPLERNSNPEKSLETTSNSEKSVEATSNPEKSRETTSNPEKPLERNSMQEKTLERNTNPGKSLKKTLKPEKPLGKESENAGFKLFISGGTGGVFAVVVIMGTCVIIYYMQHCNNRNRVANAQPDESTANDTDTIEMEDMKS